jgi:type II secretory pathway pseudopilin PulG
MNKTWVKNHKNVTKHAGFTLLELVLVLFLLTLMASATLFLTENVDSQAKYDETKRRMEIIRQAIVGDPTRRLNGQTETSGFAADMGRLPNCLRELLEPVQCDGTTSLNFWQQDIDSSLWSGWRGPYITVSPEISGSKHFRDGYGNSKSNALEDLQNSGWDYSNINSLPNTLSIISSGSDSADTSDDVTNNGLVIPSDVEIYFGDDWQKLNINFINTSASEKIIPAESLRLRFNYPIDGLVLAFGDSEIDNETKRDVSSFLSAQFPDADIVIPSISGTIAVSSSDNLTFSSPVTLTSDEVTINGGTVVTLNQTSNSSQFTMGSECSSSCTFKVPSGSTLSPAATSLSLVSGNISISPKYIAPVEAQNIAKPYIILPFGSSISSTTITLPNGATVTIPSNSSEQIINNKVVLNSSSLPASITVSEAFTLNESEIGTTITTGTSEDTFIVPFGTTNPSGNVLSIPVGMSIPLGTRSLSIVCDYDGTPAVTGFNNLGNRFDGDCTGLNTSAEAFKLVPRTHLESKSNLDWYIQ